MKKDCNSCRYKSEHCPNHCEGYYPKGYQEYLWGTFPNGKPIGYIEYCGQSYGVFTKNGVSPDDVSMDKATKVLKAIADFHAKHNRSTSYRLYRYC